MHRLLFLLFATFLLSGCFGSVSVELASDQKPFSLEEAKASEKITLEVFSDFNCIHCRDLEPIIQKLKSSLPDLEVRSYFVSLFGSSSFASAMAAECVRIQDEKFSDIYTLSVFNAKTRSTGVLESLVEKSGANLDEYNSCMKGDLARAVVTAAQEESVSRKIQGTPTLYINGEKYDGNRSYDALYAFLIEKTAK